MNEAARSRWDDPRRETVTGTGREPSDPLAELARLVGQDDPYRNVFRPATASPVVDERDWHADAGSRTDVAREHGEPAAAQRAGDWAVHAETAPAGPSYPDAVDPAWAEHDDAYHREQSYAEDDRYYAIETASHRDDAGIAEAGTAVDGAEASIPDLWASGGPAYDGVAPELDRSYDPALGRTRDGGSARRPLLVLGAVLLLTGGGLGASFLAKGGTGASVATTSGNGAPTILAATGPTKIKQDDPSTTAPEDKDAALLNKGAGAAVGNAKVVQTSEQPADLSQLPKAADAAALAQPPSQNPFPEAKKVKTFVVHPDGTPLYDDGQTAAQSPSPSAPSVPVPAPQASTPKAVAGTGVTTPPAATIASLVAGAPPATDAAPSPAAPKPAKAKPVDKAAGAGGFGLQLAASPSEAEAHAAFAKLKKKYPAELGSLSANVHQSETGGKPVYRVRVGGMSRDDASSLCSKLMAGGGSCFVVHD